MLLVAALTTRADLLMLDEPTSGLDPLMEEAFRECVLEAKERGQTVFLSSHILSEVEAVCDRVGILRDGRLVDDGNARGAQAPQRAHGRRHLRRPRTQPRPAGRGARRRGGGERAAARGRWQHPDR